MKTHTKASKGRLKKRRGRRKNQLEFLSLEKFAGKFDHPNFNQSAEGINPDLFSRGPADGFFNRFPRSHYIEQEALDFRARALRDLERNARVGK